MFGLRLPVLAVIAVALFETPPAQAANYYVSPSGSDSAPGNRFKRSRWRIERRFRDAEGSAMRQRRTSGQAQELVVADQDKTRAGNIMDAITHELRAEKRQWRVLEDPRRPGGPPHTVTVPG